MKSKTQDKNLIEYYRNGKPFNIIDAIIIFALIIVIVVTCILFIPKNNGQYVKVYSSGKLIAQYRIDKNAVIPLLDGKMTLVIDNNETFIKESDCSNLICVNTGRISKSGERIVCIPNKITVIIEGGDYVITG